MRNRLPKRARVNETAIVNLDDFLNRGTHWVAYVKKGNTVYYYDSFGNLKPPIELIKYFGNSEIYYNYTRNQSFDRENCGYLCIRFLKEKCLSVFR